MEIRNVTAFDGQHCETTATGTLLGQLGIHLSEPMLFGLGEGLGFIFWKMKTMDHPFIGGRIRPDQVTANIARNLGLDLVIKETASPTAAWDQVKALLDRGRIVGLKLDSYHLEYFSRPIHFAGHYVAMYGYDEEAAYLVDTRQQGGKVKTSLRSLAKARSEKGPMASKNLFYVLERPEAPIRLEEAARRAIRGNAEAYLNPPIANIGYRGILKTAKEIMKWFKTSGNVEEEFRTTALLMERAGTGGALFRNLYRDFLGECAHLLQSREIAEAHAAFQEIAVLWTALAALLDRAGRTRDIRHVEEAAEILIDLSGRERRAMERLAPGT